jgi:hypothetical protein
MINELRKAIKKLADPNGGWATRKEIAEQLGTLAREAILALRDQKSAQDQDVRAAVRAALKQLPIVRVTEASAAHKPHALADIASACAKEGQRSVSELDDGYKVVVKIGVDREQDVFIRPELKEDGTKLLRVSTICGKPDASSAAWALRTNVSLIGCAFAVENHGRFEHLILVQNFDWAKTSPAEVLAAVKQVAFYGDWLEKRLAEDDHH